MVCRIPHACFWCSVDVVCWSFMVHGGGWFMEEDEEQEEDEEEGGGVVQRVAVDTLFE